MKNVKVPLFGNPGKSATIDAEATNGATVGKNLFNSDGSLVTAAQLSGGTAAPNASSDLGTSDDLDEGGYNLYFTDRRAQDAVGSILAESDDVEFIYVPGVSIEANLKPTGVTAGEYGDGAQFLIVSVDEDGRIDAISTRPLIAGNGITLDVDPDTGAVTISVTDFNLNARITEDGDNRVTRNGDFRASR
ncbi:hypothetical protein ACQKIE_00235 [Luteibacter sp. NPDC031894]|uniref:hypothetical protein n=1 Tax=Luteibacter sp. NPDC031894 TaxID=3390572 RepID=UPI003D03B96E